MHGTVLLMILACCSAQETMDQVLERDKQDVAILNSLEVKKKIIKEELDKTSKTTSTSTSENNTDSDGLNFSIQNVFQKGRYAYSTGIVNNCPGSGIYFYPKPEKEQLKPPFESTWKEEGLNKVLNNMKGEVCVDNDTYGIIFFDARLTKTIPIKVAKIYHLTIHYEQQYLYEAWLPKISTAFFHFESVGNVPFINWFVGESYRHYTVTFENYQTKAPL
ncbi:hypothetical protein KW791_00880 [Candidatus Parcubacteria bacterium]|nr:hypothetical protein [Candidatus Parcubacteria bacterium]